MEETSCSSHVVFTGRSFLRLFPRTKKHSWRKKIRKSSALRLSHVFCLNGALKRMVATYCNYGNYGGFKSANKRNWIPEGYTIVGRTVDPQVSRLVHWSMWDESEPGYVDYETRVVSFSLHLRKHIISHPPRPIPSIKCAPRGAHHWGKGGWKSLFCFWRNRSSIRDTKTSGCWPSSTEVSEICSIWSSQMSFLCRCAFLGSRVKLGFQFSASFLWLGLQLNISMLRVSFNCESKFNQQPLGCWLDCEDSSPWQ